MADIFISYATSADKPDKNIANQIKDRLLQEKFSVFIDSGLEPGARWDTELDREIKDARAVVAVWSEFSLTRDWVTKECSVALRRNTLIPLTIERVDPNNMPVAFENLQYISFDSQSDIQWQSLLRAIRRLLKIKDDSLSSSGPEQPIVLTSSSAIAYNIKSALDDLSKGRIIIPPYQRDANQWDVATKSLFIESIINNFAVPAFFFEPTLKGGRTIDEIVDGQQRLMALQDFKENKFKLVDLDSAEYILPHAANYADRYFRELSENYQEAFEAYPLTIIKLNGLGSNRLQVFRRINRGGTPLSAQDIRLAYYWEKSKSVQLIRLAGLSKADAYSRRAFESAKTYFGVENLWLNDKAADIWHNYWYDKKRPSSSGQQASEMFLWALVSFSHDDLDSALRDLDLKQRVGFQYAGKIEEALDAFCAIVHYDDTNQTSEKDRSLPSSSAVEQFFRKFESFVVLLLEGTEREKAKLLAIIIGSLSNRKSAVKLNSVDISAIRSFVKSPRAKAKELGIEWPEPKGTWSGRAGYRAQMAAAGKLVDTILKR